MTTKKRPPECDKSSEGSKRRIVESLGALQLDKQQVVNRLEGYSADRLEPLQASIRESQWGRWASDLSEDRHKVRIPSIDAYLAQEDEPLMDQWTVVPNLAQKYLLVPGLPLDNQDKPDQFALVRYDPDIVARRFYKEYIANEVLDSAYGGYYQTSDEMDVD